jgi:hypothetical protein
MLEKVSKSVSGTSKRGWHVSHDETSDVPRLFSWQCTKYFAACSTHDIAELTESPNQKNFGKAFKMISKSMLHNFAYSWQPVIIFKGICGFISSLDICKLLQTLISPFPFNIV